MTPRVVTLWYRSPELLFGTKLYTSAIDIWSAACILGEFLQHRPLLPGNSEQQQIRLISELIGRPSSTVWPGFDRLPLAQSMDLGGNAFNNTRARFPNLSRSGLELFNGMMCYNPAVRMSASAVLAHPWFMEPPRACSYSMLPTHPELRNGPSGPSAQAKERVKQENAERKVNRQRAEEEAGFEFSLGQPPWKRFRGDYS